jgi:hypothetical protein
MKLTHNATTNRLFLVFARLAVNLNEAQARVLVDQGAQEGDEYMIEVKRIIDKPGLLSLGLRSMVSSMVKRFRRV